MNQKDHSEVHGAEKSGSKAALEAIRRVVMHDCSLDECPQHNRSMFLMVEKGRDDFVEVGREDQVAVPVVEAPEHKGHEHGERENDDVECHVPVTLPLFKEEGGVSQEAT